MDDVFKLILTLFNCFGSGIFRLAVAFLLVAAARGAHADLSYISPEQAARLVQEFDDATFDGTFDLGKKAWACDLFGMRSKLQVQHDLKLYALSPSEPGTKPVQSYVNTGDEPIAKYEVKGATLEGRGEKGLLDQVRVTKDGRLVSKLSIPARGITVAYAVCTGS